MEVVMERTVTKQVRLTPAEARELARVARGLGRSESDVLRMGLGEGTAALDRLESRRKNWHLLVKAAEDVPAPTSRPPLRFQ